MRTEYLSVATGVSGISDVEQIVVISRYRGCADSSKVDCTSGNAYFPIFCVSLRDLLQGVSKRRCLVSE